MNSEIWDYYEHKQGSSVWPSDNPEDSPFDTFICKICKTKYKLQMYGGRSIYDPSFEEQALTVLRDHIIVKHVAGLDRTLHGVRNSFLRY
jgi:hypothetical protein